MKENIQVNIDKNGFVYLDKTELGINYENVIRNIIFKFKDEFINGVAWLEIELPDLTKGYVVLEKVDETYTLPIKSSLLKQVGKIKLQLRITKAEVNDEIPIFKSNIFYLTVKEAINSTITVPSEYPSWIDIINQKLEVSNIIAGDNITLETDEMDITISATDTIYDDTEIKEDIEELETSLSSKVDKVNGKGLSTNDYTTDEKNKLASLNNYDDTEIRSLIPTKTSQLTNDSNYINQVKTINNQSIIGTGNIEIQGGGTNDYEQLENLPKLNNQTIIGNVEIEIPDVSNFITKEVNDLTNYLLKTQTGNNISLSIDSNTYVMTLQLKNNNNEVLSTGTIDLPLETMVVGGSYDNTTKSIILTLKNSQTVNIPVADLVSGLYSKPNTGIPKTDLASDVQTSLNKADSSIQEHQSLKTINNQSIVGTGNIEITGGSPTDNESITLNSDNEIQTVGVIDTKTNNVNKQWTGTTAEYNAITEKDTNTIYFITDDETGDYATKTYVDEKIGQIETLLSEV